MTCSRLNLSRFAVLLALTASPSLAEAQKVTGIVVDSKGKPIAGVDIQLHPTSKKDSVQKVVTGQNGEYTLDPVKFSATYDIVYSHSKMDTVVVSRLSQNKSQEINNVMYKKGEPRHILAMVDSLNSVERIIVMATAREIDQELKTTLLALIDEEVQKNLFGQESVFIKLVEDKSISYYLEGRRRLLSDFVKEVKRK